MLEQCRYCNQRSFRISMHYARGCPLVLTKEKEGWGKWK